MGARVLHGGEMIPANLTIAELAVYAAAFGAEFARALSHHRSRQHSETAGGGAGSDYETRVAIAVQQSQDSALFVADHALQAFRDVAAANRFASRGVRGG